MPGEYQSFELIWEQRVIRVSYQPNWLNSDTWHIELRCAERLPVTETGYRSHFLNAPEFDDEHAIAAYITSWLDEASNNLAWHRYLQDSRQLDLF